MDVLTAKSSWRGPIHSLSNTSYPVSQMFFTIHVSLQCRRNIALWILGQLWTWWITHSVDGNWVPDPTQQIMKRLGLGKCLLTSSTEIPDLQENVFIVPCPMWGVTCGKRSRSFAWFLSQKPFSLPHFQLAFGLFHIWWAHHMSDYCSPECQGCQDAKAILYLSLPPLCVYLSLTGDFFISQQFLI